jgi:hypothetical protein
MKKSEKIFIQLIEAHQINDTVTARRLGQEYIETAVLEQVKKAKRVAKERNIEIDPERFATKFYCTIIDHFKESGVWQYLVTDQGATK